MGAPNDVSGQLQILTEALDLLVTAESPGEIRNHSQVIEESP